MPLVSSQSTANFGANRHTQSPRFYRPWSLFDVYCIPLTVIRLGLVIPLGLGPPSDAKSKTTLEEREEPFESYGSTTRTYDEGRDRARVCETKNRSIASSPETSKRVYSILFECTRAYKSVREPTRACESLQERASVGDVVIFSH